MAAPQQYGTARARQSENPLNESLAMAASGVSAQNDYEIGPEDLLQVTLFDIEDLSGSPRMVSARVSNSGFVTLPFVGKVSAVGLTPLGLEDDLKERYTRFIHQPEIGVFIKEYRSYEITVLGYVEEPGIVSLKGRKTLIEALGLAGGLNEDAGRSVRLSRQTEDQVLTEVIDLERLIRMGDVRLNPVVLPGDVISVPRAGIFYVEGMVNNPGAFPLLQETTVSQAIATAGGPDISTARERATTLYRMRDDGTREAILIDIAEIRSGVQDDMLVMEDDLIVVPVHGPKFVVEKIVGLFRVGINAAY
jgi:polysaccharide export outer membrane protein